MNKKKLQTIREAHKKELLILPSGETVSRNSLETRLNDHMLIFGGTGSGKTRSTVTPNILAAIGSYVVADTKGNLYNQWSDFFRREGYKVIHLNLIHPEHSDGYDPLKYLDTPNVIQKFAHLMVYSDGDRQEKTGGSYDPFWDRASKLCLVWAAGMLVEKRQLGGKANFGDVSRLISKISPEKWDEGQRCEIDDIMDSFANAYQAKTGKPSWAYQQFKKFRTTPQRTMGTIMLSLENVLSSLDTPEIRAMLSADDFDIALIGKEKTIVFVEISDTDRSKDLLANMFYGQAMNRLCSFADEECAGSRLPVPVRFILDDFGTNCRIDGFENMISNIRSRGISATIILQSVAQLNAAYGLGASTIIDNCDTMVYLGGNDVSTAQMVSVRCNKPIDKFLCMPVGTNWVVRRGEEARFSRTVDLSEYDTKEYERKSEQRSDLLLEA